MVRERDLPGWRDCEGGMMREFLAGALFGLVLMGLMFWGAGLLT